MTNASETARALPPTGTPSRWKIAAWVVALWLAAHVVLVAAHVLMVFIYSVAIAPGLGHADYQVFAQRSAPWFSIVFGGPVFYGVGWLLRRKVPPHERGAGLATWGLYSAADAAIVVASVAAPGALLVGQWLVSQGVKLLAVLLATRGSRAAG